MTHYLISKEDAEIIRAALTGEALHTFESGLHVTEFAPVDFSGKLTARDFADAYFSPLARAAHANNMALYALAVEIEADEEAMYAGARADVAQYGPSAAYLPLLKDVLGEVKL